MHTASCTCGAVRIRIDGPLRPPIACHCLQCRKVSGHFTVASAAAAADVTVQGDLHWFEYKPGVAQGSCPACGAYLLWRGRPGRLSVQLGALDDTSGLAIAGHIFTAEKGDYYEIPEGVPQFPGDDEGALE